MTRIERNGAGVRPSVFIQTNAKQKLGALVSAYSLKRNSANPDAFDVRIMDHADFPFFAAKEGQPFLREGVKRVWRNDDLQSFTPLRFMPPQLMGYRGRAVVIDPDIFAVGDITELLNRDMDGKAILCRRRGMKTVGMAYASSVMLLDCTRLTHWRVEEQFSEMFQFKRDYMLWISLLLEPDGTIGLFEPEWNDFDRLTPRTRMVHNTRRRTQPWKTGLAVDYLPAERIPYFPIFAWVMAARRWAFGDYGLLGRYMPHPDPNQERLFFGLLRECLDRGIIAEELVKDEMAKKHVRPDALEVVRRSEPPARSQAA